MQAVRKRRRHWPEDGRTTTLTRLNVTKYIALTPHNSPSSLLKYVAELIYARNWKFNPLIDPKLPKTPRHFFPHYYLIWRNLCYFTMHQVWGLRHAPSHSVRTRARITNSNVKTSSNSKSRIHTPINRTKSIIPKYVETVMYHTVLFILVNFLSYLDFKQLRLPTVVKRHRTC
jgi:hypothetical protein